MVEYENECVGCSTIFHNCLGSACPNTRVPHWYCDECGEEDDLYEYDGEELCAKCVLKMLPKVTA